LCTFLACDFRDDLFRIDVPTLIIHGDADAFAIESTAARLPKLIKTVNLLSFLADRTPSTGPAIRPLVGLSSGVIIYRVLYR